MTTPVSSSLRTKIAAAVANASTQQHIEQLIDDVFGTQKATKVECPECGAEFKPKLPDVKAQVDTIISLLEQAEGKASTEPQADTQVIIERPPR